MQAELLMDYLDDPSEAKQLLLKASELASQHRIGHLYNEARRMTGVIDLEKMMIEFDI